MEPLDGHLASISNTILTSARLIDAAFQSRAETRALVYDQRQALKLMRATLSSDRDLLNLQM